MGVDPAGPRPGGTESPPLQWHSRPPLGSGAGLGCGEGRGQTAWAGHGATLSACLTAPAGCRQPHGQRRASITLVRLIRKAVFVVNFFHAEQKNTTKSSMSCSPTSQRATCSSLPLRPPSRPPPLTRPSSPPPPWLPAASLPGLQIRAVATPGAPARHALADVPWKYGRGKHRQQLCACLLQLLCALLGLKPADRPRHPPPWSSPQRPLSVTSSRHGRARWNPGLWRARRPARRELSLPGLRLPTALKLGPRGKELGLPDGKHGRWGCA